MGRSVYSTVVYGALIDDDVEKRLRDLAEQADHDTTDWSVHDLAAWIGLDAYHGGQPTRYVIGFALAETDFWSLGVFEFNPEASRDAMNARFAEVNRTYELALSPRLYLTSFYS